MRGEGNQSVREAMTSRWRKAEVIQSFIVRRKQGRGHSPLEGGLGAECMSQMARREGVRKVRVPTTEAARCAQCLAYTPQHANGDRRN